MNPVFTSNDSEISRLEGLYVKERLPPAVISGVFLGVVAVTGESIRGPQDKAIDITSEARFKEVFGGRDQGSGGPVASNLWKALANKPFGKLKVVRAVAADAAAATLTLKGALFATGTIQAITTALHVDAETVTLNDGVNSATIFEYDKTGDGVAGGHVAVNISTDTTAAQCANRLIAAINGVGAGLAITASAANTTGLINLVNDATGTLGNQNITTTVANGGYTHTGMSGGTNSGSNVVTVNATSKGAWGNNVTVAVALATDGNTLHFNLTANYLGKNYVYKNLDLSTGNDNTLAVIGSDDGNVVALVKVVSGVPAVASAASLVGGLDGTIADSDYTGTGRALAAMHGTKSVGVEFIAEKSNSNLRSNMVTAAATATDRLFLVCPNSETIDIATAVTDVGTETPSDRMVYCYNHPYTLDNDAGAEMLTHPTAWMASVLSQIDIDIHPGEEDTKKINSGITRLYQPNLGREDYITLRQAGICALEQDEGFAFVSGVTTSLTPGKEQITRRRMADYIQISIAKTLKYSVKKKDTFSRRQANAGMIESFLGDLQKNERVVKLFKVDPDILNTDSQLALGIVKILTRVKLISHALEIVLETEIGTSTVIAQAV